MEKKTSHIKLSQWFATAISGNDILSSSLYVSGIAAIFAGIYAPLVLLGIAVVLFLYKAVYIEVVEALPINGGAYNALLNSTSKTLAAIAGSMTILSYIATAVISAKVANEYLGSIVHLPVIPLTIALLFVFTLLVIMGIKDSAKVAFVIFFFHIFCLVSFLILGAIHIFNAGHIFENNYLQTMSIISANGGFLKTMFLSFAASLLGVSGFESSANFVEEQEKGVFRKTLRNMLIGVAIFNPLIALFVLTSLPLEVITHAKDFLLADAAKAVGGNIFQSLIVIDAFLVLSGAVLTSFIGVSGLIYRMASDACLPNFLTKQNNKGAHPRIVIVFFILCTSILLATGGNLLSLAGVYTLSFLGVMSSFALGNLLLRQTRSELKRTYQAPLPFVILAFTATFLGIVGNIMIDIQNLVFFSIYFIPTIFVVFTIVYQDYVLRFALQATHHITPLNRFLHNRFTDMSEGHYVVFIRHVSRLFPILQYISRNETGRKITLVYCNDSKDSSTRFAEIKNSVIYFQKAGAFNHFDIHFHQERKKFGPEVVHEVAQKLRVHNNRIFIGSIHHFHDFEYDDLGGVRIIF